MVFDFARDYLGLLKAALIAGGIIPPGMEGAGLPLSDLLDRMVGPGKGFELVCHVNNIPKGFPPGCFHQPAGLHDCALMRASGQTSSLTGALDRRGKAPGGRPCHTG